MQTCLPHRLKYNTKGNIAIKVSTELLTAILAPAPTAMPPHSDATQRRTAEELLNSISHYAFAIGIDGSGSLTSLPAGQQLSELFRHLRELSDLLRSQDAVHALLATNISSQARVALAQLHAAALRLVTDPRA